MALTDKQKKFKEAYIVLLEGGMDERNAKRLAKAEAGYSESTNLSDIMTDDLVQEFITDSQRRLAFMTVKAVIKQDEILDTPELKSNGNLQAAINSVLDRTGIAKKESREVTLVSPTGIIIMPGKKPLDPETE